MFCTLVLLVATVLDSSPQLVDAGMVAPDTIAVTLHEGSVELGSLVPYQPQDGDVVKEENTQRTSVRRGGQEIGTLAGPEANRMLREPDRFAGERIDRARLADPAEWKVAGATVKSVTFKNRVRDAAQVAGGDWKAAFEFIVYLQLESPLPEGDHLIRFGSLPEFQLHWDDTQTVSPAVHVSAIGYRPTDPGKPASLSCWTGAGRTIDYLERFPGLRYRVLEHSSGREVLSGAALLAQETEAADDYTGLRKRPDATITNRFGGPVFKLDLAKLTNPGVYRVAVDGIGCSKPFRISADVYDPLWRLALRGLHVHRRNVPVEVVSVDGETWTRPAADDSAAVHSTARMGNATFDAFVAGATNRPARNTRGGWMDAGDFDSNHSHYWVSLLLLDLIDRHPEALSADDVGISDSGNGRPDLLDEGLWMVDSYRAMQAADGGVTSGIEYAEHPRVGEPSHLNTLAVYQLAPSPRSNFLYAAASARAARVIKRGGFPSDPNPQAYLDSAAAAFRWAKAHLDDPKPDSKQQTEDAHLLAACELLVAGEEQLGSEWLEYVDSLRDNPWQIVSPELNEAVVVFLRLGGQHLDPSRRQALERMFYQTTTQSYLDGSTRKSGYGVLKNGWAPFGYGIGGAPHPGTHHLLQFPTVVPTNESFPPHIKPDRDECIAAGVTGLAFLLGHHPTNRPYVTGLEQLETVDDRWESVQNILHLDSRYAGHRAPAGITIYGTVPPIRDGNSWPINWPLNGDQTVHPQYELWPEYENLHQFPLWAAMTEYTIWQTIAPTIWFAAELHARDR